MSQRTLCFVALAILVAALSTNRLGGARDPDVDGGTSPVSAVAGGNCTPISYNRSVDGIGFRPGPAGGGATEIVIDYSLRVGDSAGAASDLSADLLVEIIVGGAVVSQTSIPALFDFLANDAVTCAVSCSSNCGSIFGDGACIGCDCDYSRSATLPEVLSTGDMVRVTMMPLAVAAPELRSDDDVLEVTFGTPSSCCPWDNDNDGTVGINDFLNLLANWGPCP